MKRYLSLLLLTTLLACNNDHEAPLTNGVTIKATQQTRTSFDGTQSAWSAGDKLQVAIGATGATLTTHEFVNDDPSAGLFTNSELTLDNTLTYDLYALYSVQNTVPDNGVAEVLIGAATQQQIGDSAAHIAALDPLYGSAMGVQANNIAIGMNHTAVALRIEVGNTTEEEIAGIKSVQITAPEGVQLYGTGTIDFASKKVAIGSDGANSITINIQNSGTLDAGSAFTVWAATAPFEMAANSVMRFTVTTSDDKVLEYKKSFSAKTSFDSGMIMSTSITPEPRPEQILIKWGYLEGYTAPEGMPSCESDIAAENTVNKIGATSGSYPTEYGNIEIDSDVKYAYVIASKCIRFRDLTSAKSADIKLPIIDGYKLTQVATTVGSGHNTGKRSNICISIIPSELGAKTPTGTTTFDLENTISTQQYSIHISNTTEVKKPCDITGIQLTYVLE